MDPLNATGRYFRGHIILLLCLGWHILVGSPILLLTGWLSELANSRPEPGLLPTLCSLVTVLILGLGFFASVSMSRYFVRDKKPFLTAFKCAWADIWISTTTLPGIRRWFNGHTKRNGDSQRSEEE